MVVNFVKVRATFLNFNLYDNLCILSIKKSSLVTCILSRSL